MTMAAPKYQVIERESLDDDEIVALGDLMAAAFGKGETSDFDIAVNGCRYEQDAELWKASSRARTAVAIRTGFVLTVNDTQGLALCFPPDTAFDSHLGGRWSEKAMAEMDKYPKHLAYLDNELRPAVAAADLAADPDYKKGMNLMVLVVDDKHREKGIATALLEAVCNKAQSLGCDVYLQVDKLNNLPFYEKRGFEDIYQTMLPAPDGKKSILWHVMRWRHSK